MPTHYFSASHGRDMGFACNVPGHREGGMVGEVTFESD